jgi:hypothetical protein
MKLTKLHSSYEQMKICLCQESYDTPKHTDTGVGEIEDMTGNPDSRSIVDNLLSEKP